MARTRNITSKPYDASAPQRYGPSRGSESASMEMPFPHAMRLLMNSTN